MIWDSTPWKDDLRRIGTDLQRRQHQRRWRDASLAVVEQHLMVGFYMVRKLMDAHKLSDAFTSQRLQLRRHPLVGTIPDALTWHNADRYYDLQSSTAETHELRFVCDQFVHSFVFLPATGRNGGLEGVFVASDRKRADGLYFLATELAAATLIGAAEDSIVESVVRRTPDGESRFTLGTSEAAGDSGR